MGPLEYFLGCTIKRDLTNITLNISQPHLINNMTKGFNKDVKSLMVLNNLYTLYKGIVRNKLKYTKILNDLQKRYMSVVVSLLYLIQHFHYPNYLMRYVNY